MSRGPRIDNDKRTKMRDLENGGWKRSAIAKELGVSNSAVTRILGANAPRVRIQAIGGPECRAEVSAIIPE